MLRVMAAATWCGRPQPLANCNHNCNRAEITSSRSTRNTSFESMLTALAVHFGQPFPEATRVAGNPLGAAGGGWEIPCTDDIPLWLIKQVR